MADKIQELYGSMTPEQKSQVLVEIMEREIGNLIENIKSLDNNQEIKVQALHQLRDLAQQKIEEVYEKEESFLKEDYQKVLTECLRLIDNEIETLQ